MFGMISQKAIYGQSEGIIRAKNKIADETGADLTGGMVWKFAPWVRVFAASDPETARVLMTLKPEYVTKAGLSDMLFGDDPKGFIGGLLYEEGPMWQKIRKILTEEFNQASLDSYVDAMDESVKSYVQRLKSIGNDAAVRDVSELNNQLTLEVMLKTVFGDQSIDLIKTNGKDEICIAFKQIRNTSNGFIKFI